MQFSNLNEIAKALLVRKKGILAADAGPKTMGDRLMAINVPPTPEYRSMWRQIMATTEGVESGISGIILNEETLKNPLPNGKMIVELLTQKNILPGIKVDKGTFKFNAEEEAYTLGLDTLQERLEEYKKLGAVFTKWRAVYKISQSLPSPTAVTANSLGLAQYALTVQKAGMLPIVEPEILVLSGDQDLKRSKEVTQIVIKDVFNWLKQFGVKLDSMILKPNMVLSGKNSQSDSTAEEIAVNTVNALLATVPDTVPGVIFLSGGLGPDQATEYIKAIKQSNEKTPWVLTFCFERALQQEGLTAWAGKQENVKVAQAAFLARVKKVSQANAGL